ncbi:MAG: ribosomal-protein-alanine N-acetyltransferase [Deltaproteobacteria bacterium RBG_16_71_12]|nr:MAG: ribosomal-protein-alanine N-acetyltransferase [Deltaproteobacteria bacterium RBG_16_71_12]
MSALVRLATADLEPLSALEARAQPLPWSEDQLLLELVHDDARVLGLLDDGALTGYVAVRRMVDEAWILNLAVDAPCRRRGLGRRLLDAARALATEWCSSSLWLEVREGNQAARALYQRFGMSERGRRAGYYAPIPPSTTRETAVVMAIDLATARDPPRR